MRKDAWAIPVGLCLFLSAVYPLFAASPGDQKGVEKTEKGETAEIKPVADEALWKEFQAIRALQSDYETRLKAAQEAIQKDRERALSTIAFYIGQETTRQDAIRFVRVYFKDSRLVPFVVDAIRRSVGFTLLEGVKTARALGDRRFLPVLIENALDSDFDSETMHPAPVGAAYHYESVFGEAAAAIYTLTKRWAGSDQYLKGPLVAKEKRTELTVQWRKWWAENKAKWEAGAPIEEKPKQADKPPEPPA